MRRATRGVGSQAIIGVRAFFAGEQPTFTGR